MKIKSLPYTPISTLRQIVLTYFEDHGEAFTGSILHVGSGPDTFDYGQYFPNAERYRCLNKWGGLGGGNFPNVDIHADVQHMPEISDDSEDVVIATFFLFQVENVNAAFNEFKRVLKPRGLFITTLTGSGWKGSKHYHVWTNEKAKILVSNFFRIIEFKEGDIGAFLVGSNQDEFREVKVI